MPLQPIASASDIILRISQFFISTRLLVIHHCIYLEVMEEEPVLCDLQWP
jgi:hypothetical protein